MVFVRSMMRRTSEWLQDSHFSPLVAKASQWRKSKDGEQTHRCAVKRHDKECSHDAKSPNDPSSATRLAGRLDCRPLVSHPQISSGRGGRTFDTYRGSEAPH